MSRVQYLYEVGPRDEDGRAPITLSRPEADRITIVIHDIDGGVHLSITAARELRDTLTRLIGDDA